MNLIMMRYRGKVSSSEAVMSSKKSKQFDAQDWKDDPVQKMKKSREATMDLFKKLWPAQIEQPRTQGEWSVKDVFAHIVAWEEEAWRRFQLVLQGQSDRIPFYDDMADTHRFNAQAVGLFRDRPLDELLEYAESVREKLIPTLMKLPAKDLRNSADTYQIVDWFPEFAWDHEEDHRDRIREWQKNQS